MSSRKEQKAQAKQQRMQAQAEREAAEKKARMIRFSAAGAALIIVVVGAFILTSQKKESSKVSENNVAGVSQSLSLIGSAEQKGNTVGDPKAKVTIVEYADLRCPVCQRFSKEAYPTIFNDLIKTGKAKLDFRNWAILGPESELAAKAALAAGEQNKGFLFADIFYANQQNEATPYVNDKFLTSIAKAAGLDIAQWNKDRKNPDLAKELEKISNEATASGFTGTPSLAVEGPNGRTELDSGATAEVVAAAVEQESK